MVFLRSSLRFFGDPDPESRIVRVSGRRELTAHLRKSTAISGGVSLGAIEFFSCALTGLAADGALGPFKQPLVRDLDFENA
jgi:hypothetical protein